MGRSQAMTPDRRAAAEIPTPGSDVTVVDVGPRDGLQNSTQVLAPPLRTALVQRLLDAGLPRVEAVSFVNPARVPAMAHAEAVVGGVRLPRDATLAGLVVNARGYVRLAATSVGEVHFAFAATEEFNRRNQKASVDDSIVEAKSIAAQAHGDGRTFSVIIGASFGCPFEGAVAPSRILHLAERLIAGGADEIIFADTIGVGVPRQVRELVAGGRSFGVPVGAHFHNTRNTGYVNALVAVEAGVSILEASVGGTGGCPFAPRATGNIATEDLVYLLHGEGVRTGIDLDALVRVSEWLDEILDEPVPGLVRRAGVFAPVAAGPRPRAGQRT